MARRGMPEVWFGSNIYLWGQHESMLATLWRTIARANWPLWVVECVVLFASPPTANNWRHLWWGLCWRERAQAPMLKEVHKEQVGLATHASTTATQ
jgi:hypothetical protein